MILLAGIPAVEIVIRKLFGTSIRLCTHAAADYIAKTIEELFGTPPAKITINIAGVKSKHVVKRSTKVEYVYEA